MPDPAVTPAPAGGTPPVPPTPAAPVAAPPVPAPSSASKSPDPPTPAVTPATPASPAAPVVARPLGDDDEPKPGERIELTSDALAKRMQRATRAQLKAEFGTDDTAVLKEKLAKLTTFEAAEETRRQAALTETQRLTEERDRALEAKAVAEARTQEVEERHEVGEAEGAIKESLKDVIKPKFWRHVREDLATFLADNHDPEKLDAMTDAEREVIVKGWAAKYVEENPEYAVTAAPGTPAPVVAPARVPLTNGTANPPGGADAKPAPVITTGRFAGKTAAPGRPNSMSAKEFADWKRETGNSF